MKFLLYGAAIVVSAFVSLSVANGAPTNLTLWYDKPATEWEHEALPIGNAYMGAMIFGGTAREQIQFNEESLWIGDEENTGAYQAFGDLAVEFSDLDKSPKTSYRRELDISRSVHTVSFEANGIKYRREAFASYPAKVLVFRFTADKPGSLTGAVSMTDAHNATISAEGNRITNVGSLKDYQYEKNSAPYALALNYEAQAVVVAEGGTVTASGGKIAFSKANSVLLILGAGTDFVQNRAKGWKGELPHAKVTTRVDAAVKRSWDELLEEHTRDYQSLFNRVSLDLGSEGDASIPTDVRIANVKKTGVSERGLETLLFQFARYLMISSSRPGSLPANLQGKWNSYNTPQWRSDYHTDINVQMNYWFVDAANLSECFQPFAEWVQSIRAVRTDATQKTFHKRGWVMRAESGIFGGSTWEWIPGTSAWLLQNSYDHYRFTGDKEYLRTLAYPAMKEVCEYWIDSLEEQPDGTLITPTGFSPEQGPHEKGISFDQQQVWELFNNTIEASAILGVDGDFRKQLTAMREKLLPPKIGKWGQLQEWMVDRDDPKNTHVCLSHLIGLYPGRQISLTQTPALAEAACVSLKARGDGGTGWSMANKCNLWARLRDGNHAYKLLAAQMALNIRPNLLDSCYDDSPFQIDGNFGYAAGVCEMLLQSHQDEIDLLPALPKEWASGSAKGLRARGGFLVDMTWKDGTVTSFQIVAPTSQPTKVRVNGVLKTVTPISTPFAK